jgi:hypothetical protein
VARDYVFLVAVSRARSFLGLAAVLLAPLAVAAPVAAETITLGANLQTAVYANAFGCTVEGGCTDAQTSAGFVSPISGTIVRWRVRDSSGALTLRTVGEAGGPIGPTIHPKSSAIETFPVNLPIKAGEAIGLDIAKFSGDIGVARPGGTTLETWDPALAPGEIRAPTSTSTEFELLMNVDIQPPPGIASVSPAAVPADSAIAVTISGHDFTEATAVRFGSAPAAFFQVDSDTQITAITPKGQSGAVTVAVTTVAGTATAPFTFEAPPTDASSPPPSAPPPSPVCDVPTLNGKKLKAAKKRVRAADCSVGKITKRRGATARTGKVIKQWPPAGSVRPAGTAVRIKVG